MYVRLFSVKVSSVWISWNAREQINDVVLKTFCSHKSFYRVFLGSIKKFSLFKANVLTCRNLSIDIHFKSGDCFLYDGNTGLKWVKILIPVGIYLLKVNNRNARARC